MVFHKLMICKPHSFDARIALHYTKPERTLGSMTRMCCLQRKKTLYCQLTKYWCNTDKYEGNYRLSCTNLEKCPKPPNLIKQLSSLFQNNNLHVKDEVTIITIFTILNLRHNILLQLLLHMQLKSSDKLRLMKIISLFTS